MSRFVSVVLGVGLALAVPVSPVVPAAATADLRIEARGWDERSLYALEAVNISTPVRELSGTFVSHVDNHTLISLKEAEIVTGVSPLGRVFFSHEDRASRAALQEASIDTVVRLLCGLFVSHYDALTHVPLTTPRR